MNEKSEAYRRLDLLKARFVDHSAFNKIASTWGAKFRTITPSNLKKFISK